jgi:hypothetical protein
VEVAKFPWGASGRALTFDRPDGLTKLIVDPETERVLGVGIVGHGAGELIAEGVVAIEMGATVRDLAESVHPHPTLSETIMEAAEVFTAILDPHLDIARNPETPHVRHYFAPGRRQDDADRKAAALRRRRPIGRLGHGPQTSARHHFRLDGTGAQARHLHQLDRAAIRLRRLPHQSA